MKFLNRIFSSPKDFAVDEEINEKSIAKNLEEYYKTIPEKERIINKLSILSLSLQSDLQRLKELLDLELVDINLLENEEKDIIIDIKELEHNKKIKRVNHLEETLAYAETKYKYSWELLRNIYASLVLEKQIIDIVWLINLNKYSKEEIKAKARLIGLNDYQELRESLKLELAIEKTLIKKIKERETFPKLFSNLINGEQIIYKLDKKEQRLVKTLNRDAPVGGITDRWITTIFDSMENAVHELVAEGTLDQHPDMGFEFVNRPEFTDLVRRVVKSLRPGKKLSEPTINAFVHLFREKYNDERDY